jgi:adenosylcobyric acid synthase
MSDLAWLRERGLDRQIVEEAGRGAAVIGVCGGYQMLGRRIIDEEGVESETAAMDGLGLLPAGTVFTPVKATNQMRGHVTGDTGLLAGARGLPITGYEIHMGRTATGGAGPAFAITERSGHACEIADGALSSDGWVLGTYVHGLFDNHTLRATLLHNLAQRKGVTIAAAAGLERDREYDKLAAAVRAALDMQRVYQIIGR